MSKDGPMTTENVSLLSAKEKKKSRAPSLNTVKDQWLQRENQFSFENDDLQQLDLIDDSKVRSMITISSCVVQSE